MKNNNLLISTAYENSQYPKPYTSEVAICGRSNCGKSTLINAILGSKRQAHTSSKPGKTISINFFKYEEKLTIVDLPGYGYAKVPFKTRNKWKDLVEDYLSSRKQLKGALLLIDVRRKVAEEEVSFVNWLNERSLVTYIIFTKIDKLSNNELTKKKRELLAQINNLWQDDYSERIFYISAPKKTGIDKLKKLLKRFI